MKRTLVSLGTLFVMIAALTAVVLVGTRSISTPAYASSIPPGVNRAINRTFTNDRHADEAKRVSLCESGWRTTAVNGQYRGLFQMGASERATYGESDTALGQTQAAHRYFRAVGHSWGPWGCKP